MILGLTVTVAACGSSAGDDPSGGPAEMTDAKAEMWNAIWTGDLAAAYDARQHLLALVASQPDEEAYRLIGRSFGLVNAEAQSGKPVPKEDVADMQASMTNEDDYLKKAIDASQDPYEKALNIANYSGSRYSLSKLSHDAAGVQHAIDLMNQVKDQYPALGLFAKAPKLMRAQKSDPDYAQAMEDIFQGYEACLGRKIDRAHPDMSGATTGPFPYDVCGNNPKAPHTAEGTLMIFGDMLVKNGQVDAARPVYEEIKKSAAFSTWPYKDQVDARLSSDLAARAKAYDDPNGTPRSQPVPGASPCLSCHQR
jgi:hypothetical protein